MLFQLPLELKSNGLLDVDTIDNQLGDALRMAVTTGSSIIASVILVAVVQPYFLIAMLGLAVLYTYAYVISPPICDLDYLYLISAFFYRASARELKRLGGISQLRE